MVDSDRAAKHLVPVASLIHSPFGGGGGNGAPR